MLYEGSMILFLAVIILFFSSIVLHFRRLAQPPKSRPRWLLAMTVIGLALPILSLLLPYAAEEPLPVFRYILYGIAMLQYMVALVAIYCTPQRVWIPGTAFIVSIIAHGYCIGFAEIAIYGK